MQAPARQAHTSLDKAYDYLDGSAASAFVVNVEQALAMGSVVSVITTMELLGWRGHSAQSRRDAENLLHSMGEVGLTREVVGQVIELRSQLAIKLPDAIIAASALAKFGPCAASGACKTRPAGAIC